MQTSRHTTIGGQPAADGGPAPADAASDEGGVPVDAGPDGEGDDPVDDDPLFDPRP